MVEICPAACVVEGFEQDAQTLHEATKALESLQHGKEWTVRVSNSFSGGELCLVRASMDQTLAEVSVLTRLARLKARPLKDDVTVVFVGDGKVLHDGLTLENVFPGVTDSSEPRQLWAVEQPTELAANALHRARCDYILASSSELNISMDRSLPDEPFGETLALMAYKALSGGHSLQGRIQFCTQDRGVTQTREDNWQLSRGQMRVNRPETDKFSVLEQIRKFGRVTFTRASHEAWGDIGLTVLDHCDAWKTEEEFVNFWASMSERRLSAYFVGLQMAKKGALALGRRRSSTFHWVDGIPKTRDLWQLARKAGELSQP